MDHRLDHLSALDAAFLHLETAEMPMHVGGMMLLALPPPAQAGFVDAVRRHIGERLHLAGVFTKKLALMPLDLANPVWVHDGDVDLDYHVRQISLPAPGTREQLEACVGRLHSALLDRSRPLWEFYVVTGLASGEVGFYTKLHHAALDGQGAIVLAQALLDLGPVPRVVEAPPPHRADAVPAARALLSSALRHTLAQCAAIVRSVPAGVRAAAGLLAPHDGDGGKRRLAWPASLSAAPRTPLNASITSQRVFATATIALPEALEVGKFFGGTLNDALLGAVSGALRRYLALHDLLPAKSLVAAVPVSLRDEGNTDLNNQVSITLVKLASDVDDPARRMKAIVKASASMKKTLAGVKTLMPTDFPSIGLPWLMSAAASLYGRARLADALPPVANVVVSNVPGPRVPLFLAGARVVANYPVSIITHGLALNVTVQSYAGSLDVGIIACRRAMPDVALFAGYLADAHAELLALARASAPRRTRATQTATAPAPVGEAAPRRQRAAQAVPDAAPRPRRAAAGALQPSPQTAPTKRRARASSAT